MEREIKYKRKAFMFTNKVHLFHLSNRKYFPIQYHWYELKCKQINSTWLYVKWNKPFEKCNAWLSKLLLCIVLKGWIKILILIIATVLARIEKIIKTGQGLFLRLNNFNEQFIICQHRRTRQVVSFLACKRDLYFVLKSMFAAVKWVKYKLHRNRYTSLSKNYAVGHQIKGYLSKWICLWKYFIFHLQTYWLDYKLSFYYTIPFYKMRHIYSL